MLYSYSQVLVQAGLEGGLHVSRGVFEKGGPTSSSSSKSVLLLLRLLIWRVDDDDRRLFSNAVDGLHRYRHCMAREAPPPGR